MTEDVQQSALTIAANMIDAGIPIFAAPPCPSGPFALFAKLDLEDGSHLAPCTRPGHAGGAVEYDLPPKWQLTIPAKVWLERWRPGWALAAVGGGPADFLDEDPRNGGDASVGQMVHDATWPITFGQQDTPSGGRHYVIPALHERKVTGFLPGLDYQGGMPTDGKGGGGQGRGFIWIAPTVKLSKIDGTPRPYVWTAPPDLAALAAASGGSLGGVRAALAGWREKRTTAIEPRPGGSVLLGGGMTAREFTETQAREFCNITLRRLAVAEIGHIEEETNAAAVALSHFVPQFWSEEQAFDVLLAALGETAYDPMHPASQWEADKFRAVLVGQRGRAPGDWFAVRAAEAGQWGAELERAVTDVEAGAADEVAALLAEMLPPSALAARRPPRYMIKGLLSYDSETWLIGGPGSKKSFVALDMAAHVALGRDWQGLRVHKGIAVLIVGEGAGSIGKRISAWEKAYGPMPDGAMRILPRPVQAKDPRAWAVLVAAVRRLRAALDAQDPGLGMFIAVDTQARSTVGLDENSAEEMGVYVEALAALRAASGGCVMSVHHTTKAGGSTRGSGAQDGAQYSRLLMKSEKKSLISSLISDKQKDMEEADPIELRFHKVDLGLDEDGEAIDSLVLTPRDEWGSALFDGESARGVEREVAELDAALKLPEPREWTKALMPNGNSKLARQILQAMEFVGTEVGRTEASIRKMVIERWYPKGEGRGAGYLRTDTNETGWVAAWKRCRELTTGGDPEPVIVVSSGPKYALNPLVRTEE